jgi:hypothetical protein
VLARHNTQDSLWLQLQLPDGKKCFVNDITGDLEGDPDKIPFADDFPPLPQPKPGDPTGPSCSAITSDRLCNSTPGCSYNYTTKACVNN